MFGLAKDVPLTRETFLAAVHPRGSPHRRRHICEAAFKGQSAVTDVRVVHPDGQVRWIRVRARSHLDETGTPDQLGGIFVDITEQKAAETEAELQRQEVTHLMRVSVLGELSGAIAHEVNQPLTAILSNAQAALYLLGRDAPNLAEVRDALLDIVQEDNRAGEVIQRLRSLLKKGENQVRAGRPQRTGQFDDSTASQRADRPAGRGRDRPCGGPARRVRAIPCSCSRCC